jgi:hypothetical protein
MGKTSDLNKKDVAFRRLDARLDPLRERLIANGHYYGLHLEAGAVGYLVYYGQDLLFSEASAEKVLVRAEALVKYKEGFGKQGTPLGELTELEWAYRIFWA